MSPQDRNAIENELVMVTGCYGGKYFTSILKLGIWLVEVLLL